MTLKVMRNQQGPPQSNEGKSKREALEMAHGQSQVHLVSSGL